MNTETSPSNCNVHHGRNVKRFREMMGIKQAAFAEKLEMKQQILSRLEAKEKLDDDILNKIAKALNVPVDIIKNFMEEGTVNIISNCFDNSMLNAVNHNCIFNPLDKVVELYERIVKEKEEQIAIFEKLLKEKR